MVEIIADYDSYNTTHNLPSWMSYVVYSVRQFFVLRRVIDRDVSKRAALCHKLRLGLYDTYLNLKIFVFRFDLRHKEFVNMPLQYKKLAHVIPHLINTSGP